MSRAIKTVLAMDGLDAEEVRMFLPGEGGIDVIATIDATGGNGSVRTQADLLVVACKGYSDTALGLIDAAVKEVPDRPVVVLSAGSPNGFTRRVFDAGADDIVVLPEAPDKVLFALEKAVARKRGTRTGTGTSLAPLITVLGPKGGTGKTLTTSNLAVGLADRGYHPVVVDLDLQFGDIGLALGLPPDKTIYDLVRSGGSLDAEKLDAYLAEHASGARALLAPVRPDHAGAVTVDFLREVWRLLRATSDYVIVDTPPDFTPEVIAAIDTATDICMVGMLDSLSLKNTKLGLETLGLMGYDPDQITLVLNRAGSRVGISEEDVVGILGREPNVLVPSDRDIPRAINGGMPIVVDKPRSDAAAAFRTLASVYAGEDPAAKPNGRRRLLSLRRNG
jgi:pilus assembly protein CpaE